MRKIKPILFIIVLLAAWSVHSQQAFAETNSAQLWNCVVNQGIQGNYIFETESHFGFLDRENYYVILELHGGFKFQIDGTGEHSTLAATFRVRPQISYSPEAEIFAASRDQLALLGDPTTWSPTQREMIYLILLQAHSEPSSLILNTTGFRGFDELPIEGEQGDHLGSNFRAQTAEMTGGPAGNHSISVIHEDGLQSSLTDCFN